MQGISALSFSSSARYDAIDGIAKPEVGQWPGVRRRSSPRRAVPDARRWRRPDAPSRQAGGRHRFNGPQLQTDTRSPNRTFVPAEQHMARLDDRSERSCPSRGSGDHHGSRGGRQQSRALAAHLRDTQIALGGRGLWRCFGDGVRVGRHLCRHICRHFMMWRPWIGRNRRSERLSIGQSGPRLVSIVPHPAGPIYSTAVSRGLDGLRRRPSTTPRIRVVWMKDP
jgi:hypothetical protein